LVERLLFFSDAVFAIVLTLLVLDLHPLPLASLSGPHVWTLLAAMAPHFYAFTFSFFMVGMWWTVHMQVTRDFARFDGATAALNLMFLLAIALMPFVAGQLGSSNWESNEALALYWIVNAAAAIALMLIAFVATRAGGRYLASPISGRLRAFGVLATGAPAAALVGAAWFTLHGRATEATITAPIVTLVAVGLSRFLLPKASNKTPSREQT
jgi:uncharacterized membrane protein